MTTSYRLYLESGPKRRKTMVHALDLPGCVAVGPTTEEALAATRDAIRAYLRFLRRHGEPVDPDAPFETHIVEHVTDGQWLGNGSPYIVFGPDLEPITEDEIATALRRYRWAREEIAAWAATQTDIQLDPPPESGGRTARAVLLHILGATGGYFSASLGGMTGFSALHSAAERGEVFLADALPRSVAMLTERVRAATPEQRAAVIQRPNDVRTLRKALRRQLEHDWEHLAELSRRAGGPPL